MRRKRILAFVGQGKGGAKGKPPVLGGDAAKVREGPAFETWLSAYRNHLEEICGSAEPEAADEPSEPSPAETVGD